MIARFIYTNKDRENSFEMNKNAIETKIKR